MFPGASQLDGRTKGRWSSQIANPMACRIAAQGDIDPNKQHLRDLVVWMRPSDSNNRYHTAGGWSFLDLME